MRAAVLLALLLPCTSLPAQESIRNLVEQWRSTDAARRDQAGQAILDR